MLSCFLLRGRGYQEPPLKDGKADTEVPIVEQEKVDNPSSKISTVVFGLIQTAEILLIGYLVFKLVKTNQANQKTPKEETIESLEAENYKKDNKILNLKSWVWYLRNKSIEFYKFWVAQRQEPDNLFKLRVLEQPIDYCWNSMDPKADTNWGKD